MLMHSALLSQDTFTTRRTTSELVFNRIETEIILHFSRYRQIAAGSPQWPQAFYPMKKINTVQPGEVVTARCYFPSKLFFKKKFMEISFILMEPGVPIIQLVSTMKPTLEELLEMKCAIST